MLTKWPVQEAESAVHIFSMYRQRCSVENGLHYRRDATVREDHSQLRLGHAPHLLAIFNNIVIGLMAREVRINLAEVRREFAYQFDQALATLAA